jgi:hypothetical protein
MRNGSAGCRREENGFLEIPACAIIARDKQSNLMCDSKMVHLYNDIT